MLISFFGEPALKAAVRRRVAEHEKLDQIAQGNYWDGHKGCFIGCSLHSNRHLAFEQLLGLPTWFAYLGERIFERTDFSYARTFPLRVYDAIPVGADLEPVKARFLSWLILDPEHGVSRHNDDPRVRAVGDAWARVAKGEVVSVAWTTAVAHAAYAARAAAADTTAHAAYAARAAADAADAADARAAAVAAQGDKLIELLASAPVIAKEPELPATVDFTRYYEQVRCETPS